MTTHDAASAGHRRFLPDRRRRPTPWLSRHWLSGRRRGGRRAEERRNVYVDRYSPGEYGLILAVLLLVVLDTGFTMRHVGLGIDEANPIMRWALDTGGALLFAGMKVGSTSLALVLLLMHIRFRPTRALLLLALIVYAGVLGLHVRLLQVTG